MLPAQSHLHCCIFVTRAVCQTRVCLVRQQVRTLERLQALMVRAAQKRSTGATAANEHSSRSHMVFMLTIIGSRASTGQSVHGALSHMPRLHLSRAQCMVRKTD